MGGLRWLACDPGTQVFICAYDPITGDIYLIGSEMGAWIRTILKVIDGLKSVLSRTIDAKNAVHDAHKAWIAAKGALATLRRDPNSTLEERAELALKVDKLQIAYLNTQDNVANSPEFKDKEAEIQALYRKLQTQVKAFHQVAAGFLQAFPIVILPRFNQQMLKRGGSGPQGTDKTILTMLSHAAFYGLLCRRMASEGRRPLVPTEAFSSQACIFCGNMCKVGRAFIYKCSKCKNWWHRDANGAAMICLFVIIRGMDWLGLD
ncbi:hypothetical protein HDU87_003280 [Geranomyces variabilis]|uniref:Cas12f1-like TNB domain-containing protein n=1 Tax=Geranomyces variabilis TaxID=109894 RepID=A0AAD5TKH3_9FUNG|nr:hypothetical protein HDU87_003280 [Geranomyces variabilis]